MVGGYSTPPAAHGYATVTAYATHLNATIQQNINLWTYSTKSKLLENLLLFRR